MVVRRVDITSAHLYVGAISRHVTCCLKLPEALICFVIVVTCNQHRNSASMWQCCRRMYDAVIQEAEFLPTGVKLASILAGSLVSSCPGCQAQRLVHWFHCVYVPVRLSFVLHLTITSCASTPRTS